MVADTAITGGGLTSRQREYQIKIVPSRDGRALLGFAGDQHYGRQLMEDAASLPAGARAVEVLVCSHRQYPSVDFAYAYIDQAGPHLIRISEGAAQKLAAFHIGLPDAFEHFQRIRHRSEIDPTPEAIRTFVCGSRSPEPVPRPLSAAITSMLCLFAERSEHDVGGWPVPYFLTSEGAFFCGYGYSVSDPVLRKIGPGSVVPHGTPEAGGFGLSVTEISPGKGMVVYWLQRPGGTVFLRTAVGYSAQYFGGRPSKFKQTVFSTVGEPINLLFSEQPHGPPKSITVLRDEAGALNMAIGKHGDSFSLSVLNVETPFRVRADMGLKLDSKTEIPGGHLSTDQLSLSVSSDKLSATLGLLQNGQPINHVTIQAAELDFDHRKAWRSARRNVRTRLHAAPAGNRHDRTRRDRPHVAHGPAPSRRSRRYYSETKTSRVWLAHLHPAVSRGSVFGTLAL